MAHLAGVVDAGAAIPLHQNARELAGARKPVVIELSAAERLDASALQILLALQKAMTASGKTLSVAATPPQIRNYLEIAGVSGLLLEGSAGAPSIRPRSRKPREEG